MAEAEAAPAASSPRLLNRQLSWLAFNRRVLALAEDRSLPFADRMRFVSIWANNLDEYFIVRLAELMDDAETGRIRHVADGLTAREQLVGVRAAVIDQQAEAVSITRALRRELAADGFALLDWSDIDDLEQKHLAEWFTERVFPILTPLAVDPGHPFPFISNLSLNIGLLIADPRNGVNRFARVKIPADLLGRYVRTADGVLPLEQLVAANLDQLFPGVDVIEQAMFRVSRNADISVNAERLDAYDDDLLTAVESEVRMRRFGEVVRVEIDTAASTELRSVLAAELGATDDVFYEVDGPQDLASYCDIDDLVDDRPDFRLERLPQSTPAPFAGIEKPADVFEVIRNNDVLVHHPYDSFDDTVLAFINAAADDPKVQAIKITLYRTSGDGHIVEALVRAAGAGKQVVVVVELKARFDEEANISWARRLERAGVHLAFGFVAMKVHTKTCLVVRVEGDTLRRYCHFGTGNYNNRTARLYTDMGLFTAHPAFGADLSALFNSLTGFHSRVDYQELVVAPGDMRHRLEELIDNEARYGAEGHIRIKVNSLVDPEIIECLYAASQAGVRIELVVRGMCCLRPGVPGLSETVTVKSVLGRYLEHARVYWFAHGESDDSPHYLVGSADLMSRNLDRRVEALVPVNDPTCTSKLNTIMLANLADDRRSWTLRPDGSWSAPSTTGSNEMHLLLHSDRASA